MLYFGQPFSTATMPKVTGAKFREILNTDGYEYILISKNTEPIDINFPNLPHWHKEEFDEWRHEILPDATVIWFEYKGSQYKLLRNMGDADCNDGSFGALFDGNDDKILDLLSTGDMETTIESLKNDDTTMDADFSTKLTPYLRFFEVILKNNTQFEYLVFKVLVENDCLYDIDDIDDRYNDESDDEQEEEEEEEEENK